MLILFDVRAIVVKHNLLSDDYYNIMKSELNRQNYSMSYTRY